MDLIKKRTLAAVASLVLVSGTAHPQSPAPAFEVADIKPSAPSNPSKQKGQVLPGGHLEIPSATLKDLMGMAYGVRENMIIGGPKWAENQRFDVLAKAPSDAAMPVLRLMMQTLLAERFKVVFHREDQAMLAYVLTVGKRAAKYRAGSGGRQTCDWKSGEGGLRRRECQNITMAELANQLPGWAGIGIDIPVVDQTGLKGAFDFELELGTPIKVEADRIGGSESTFDSGPTIFLALEQIGLKLDSRQMTVLRIVIDRAESPTGN